MTNYQQQLEREWQRPVRGKKVDIGAMYDLLVKAKQEEAREEIERIRRHRKQSKIYAEIPRAPWKRLGQQSLVDVPTDISLEQIILEQIGKHHVYGDPWRCDKCGAQFQMGLPPDKCPRCGRASLIVRKEVNLRC